MFRSLATPETPAIGIEVDGRRIACAPGENLAAVLLRAGFGPFRSTPVSGAPRMPYCMMGVCFDCLAVVDGVPNSQTCLTAVADGMTVRRQEGASAAAFLAAEGLADE
ncbi:MAG: (2Fe-2S)-binding protein [Rhizobiales bacterium]|nr:(2Fe-2S)-binding protein [Hyphomicrobiales bacterium]OJU38207.1 MAG: hypothetical protein BGN94_05400 [Rhizobiales bacterium 68-8]